MKALEFLEQVRKAEEEIHVLNAKKRHYYDLVASIGVNLKPVVVSGNKGASKTETAAVGLVYLMEQIELKINGYIELVKRADELIGKIKQDKFRKILIYRYLCNYSWKTIRDEMDYTDEKSVYRCHRYALRELQKLM